jgi:hypothetical protein
MIGNTPIEQQLRLATKLDDAKTWFDVHTNDIKNLILELIRQKQLWEKGVDKFNEIIGLYSPVTESINPEKVAGTPFTLKDSGFFYRSMFITVLKDSILIEADAKDMEGQRWWKEQNILGLTEQNMNIYVENLRAKYIKYTRLILGIN